MNILHIASGRTWRGGERQVSYLMHGLHKGKHHQYLLGHDSSPLNDKLKEVYKKFFRYKSGLTSFIANAQQIKKICNDYEIDIIHAHDSYGHTQVYLAYILTGLKTQSVVSRRLANPIKRRSLSKYNYPKTEKIICVSQGVKGAIVDQIVDKKRLEVIYSGIDLSNMKEKNSTQSESFSIVYSAAFTEEKGHNHFFKIAESLLQSNFNKTIRFVLLGDGPLLETYKAKYKNEKSIIFRGFVNNVEEELAKCDLVLHTSTNEALGTAILDAMKLGLPIFAHAIGGIPEIVKPNVNGHLFEIGAHLDCVNQIGELIQNPEICQTLGQGSQQLVKGFDKDEMVRTTEVLYKSILV